MRVALIHDALLRFGGAERVLQALHEMYPRAPIYTAFFDERAMRRFFPNARVRVSFLEGLRRFIPRRILLPFLPLAFETFDLRGYDLVISSSSAFAKGVVASGESVHLCYCHTPPRFLWEDRKYIWERLPRLVRPFAAPVLHWLRLWDIHAAQRPDVFIANSAYTARRIGKYYRRNAGVVYPPLGMQNVESGTQNGNDASNPKFKIPAPYFLVVSQLRSYKRIDIAVTAFSKLGLPLVVIGEGPERKRLENIAADNVRFLGWVSDDELRYWYEHARACVFPTEDDFGLVPLEAMSFGTPVLAYGRGGARETVEEGVTGEFFEEQVPESLADGVRRILEGLREGRYDKKTIRHHASRFSGERFAREFREALENAILEAGKRRE